MKKIFILLPDGVGLRNFAYTKFNEIGVQNNFDITYWNNTDFDLSSLGLKELKIEESKTNPISDLYKRARKIIELKQNVNKTNDKVYLSYLFPSSYKGIKNSIKSILVTILVFLFNSQKGLTFIKSRIFNLERKTVYYNVCKKTLLKEKPKLVFLTNQRPLTAIAPLLAAKDLKIPTVTFIFSWDNLPKGVMVVESDYYFVWSEHMKDELMFYYPEISENQIKVTGTPQFELHYEPDLIMDKSIFYKKYNLDTSKKYICFSGDDVTTSPNDQYYLEDVAEAVEELNKKGENIGVIYRKCPVDFTDRHLEIYKKYKDIIVLIDPLWENMGSNWNNVKPTKKDMNLLATTVFYTDLVINIGSSMVFDYIAQNKLCAYLNYNTETKESSTWSIENIYKYVHFKSMPSNKAVLWINSKNDIQQIVKESLKSKKIESTKDWYHKICGNTPNKSSENIWKNIDKIIK